MRNKNANTSTAAANPERTNVNNSAIAVTEDEDDDEKKICLKCDRLSFKEYNFCPYCGSNEFKPVEPIESIPGQQHSQRIADKVHRSSDIWVCGSCETSNEMALDNCKNCGKEFWPED